MVTNFNMKDMASFGQWCLSTVPLVVDQKEVERWMNYQLGEITFEYPDDGIKITIYGDATKEAIEDFELCKKNGVMFNWQGITIPTNEETGWIFSYRKTK